ncbi:hypothetical protein HPB49_005380 [Dermacentor silvarum]|uniref:Uncharacterized protein n=1 Tax=Dermacentor silvarum TaxID=543639 RepID=A0ACB8DVH9_DERSI|nr:hypothetical protein HPB49_005380 [Dermacentor silvarum]
MFKLMGNGCLSTVVEHPHDANRVIFLSFDPCHVLKNVRSQFLERELTDGVGDISGIFVQKLYEHQKDMTVKLARNLTKKHVYPTNLEKMNVLRAVQTFSPQVIAAIEHLQENTGGDSTLYVFSKASSTIHFMKTIKRWFDIHDTTYAGSGQKSPISNTDDPRLLWLANEFTSYIEGIQENSKARGNGGFTCETFEALRFTTKSTVETARFLLRNGVNCVLTRKLNRDPIEAIFGRIRFMCGGNDMLDARAVTTALDHIIKSETSIGKKLPIPCGDAEELAAALPQSLTEELNDLAEYPDTPSPSVTYSGLVYVAGYIAKLISDFECDACSILLETHERSDPLYTLLQSQDFSRLHYPKAEFVALLDKISARRKAAHSRLPASAVQKVPIDEQLKEDAPSAMSCPANAQADTSPFVPEHDQSESGTVGGSVKASWSSGLASSSLCASDKRNHTDSKCTQTDDVGIRPRITKSDTAVVTRETRGSQTDFGGYQDDESYARGGSNDPEFEQLFEGSYTLPQMTAGMAASIRERYDPATNYVLNATKTRLPTGSKVVRDIKPKSFRPKKAPRQSGFLVDRKKERPANHEDYCTDLMLDGVGTSSSVGTDGQVENRLYPEAETLQSYELSQEVRDNENHHGSMVSPQRSWEKMPYPQNELQTKPQQRALRTEDRILGAPCLKAGLVRVMHSACNLVRPCSHMVRCAHPNPVLQQRLELPTRPAHFHGPPAFVNSSHGSVRGHRCLNHRSHKTWMSPAGLGSLQIRLTATKEKLDDSEKRGDVIRGKRETRSDIPARSLKHDGRSHEFLRSSYFAGPPALEDARAVEEETAPVAQPD